MGVFNDMASDAGYRYGTDENKQMAEMIEEQQRRDWEREQYNKMTEEEQAEEEAQLQNHASAQQAKGTPAETPPASV